MQAKRVRLNNITFDSNFEAEVYQQLVRKFGSKNVQCHFKVELKPPTSNFPAINWEIDFRIATKGGFNFFEAKGLITREFKLKIAWLEYEKPDIYDNLYFVVPPRKLLETQKVTKTPFNRIITKNDVMGLPISPFWQTSQLNYF